MSPRGGEEGGGHVYGARDSDSQLKKDWDK